MPRKKKEETEETVAAEGAGTEAVSDEAPVEAVEAADAVVESAPAEVEVETEAVAEPEKPAKKSAAKSKAKEASAETPAAGEPGQRPANKRAERVGVVSSDKMTKTVVVRVDRLIKHPIYRKYVKRRKNFMAHDELGAGIGDKVRIVETRPLSARKRWRVVEIIQKAQK